MKGQTIPMPRLLVALDGSHLAEAVLPLVRTLAMALGAQITLLHVLEHHPPTTIHGERHLTTKAEADAYLNGLAEQLRADGFVAETHVHANPQQDVAGSIAAHATELNVDMIVLAAHGHGGIREWVVGRIPQQVAAKAGRAVMIVPVPTQKDLTAIHRIMLPVDQAGEARAAIPITTLLATAFKAELILETVVPTPGTVPGEAGVATVFLPRTTAELLKIAEDQARANLEHLANLFAGEGISATTYIQRGDPARELAHAISMHNPDMVIMATHGRVGLDGLWAGSVGPRVVSAATCPVLLVPIQE